MYMHAKSLHRCLTPVTLYVAHQNLTTIPSEILKNEAKYIKTPSTVDEKVNSQSKEN